MKDLSGQALAADSGSHRNDPARERCPRVGKRHRFMLRSPSGNIIKAVPRYNHVADSYNDLLVDNAPSIAILFSRDMKFLTSTKMAKKILKHEDSAALGGMSFTDVFSLVFGKPWIEKTLALCGICIGDGKNYNYEEKISFLDGGEMYSQILIDPVYDASGTLSGIIILISDVTEMMLSKKTAEDALESKNTFFTSISHEIRTPMNAIKGLSELLLLTNIDGVQKEYTENIVSASNSLLKILTDVLDYSNIGSNKVEIIESTYDFASFLGDISNIISLRAREKNLNFITDIEPGLPSILRGDDLRVKQVLVNIIDNSLKYTAEGSVTLGVHSNRSSSGFELLFTISDTDTDANEKKMDGLFNTSGETQSASGEYVGPSGFGLSVAGELISLMGGSIEAENNPGEGSVFRLRIPQIIENDESLARVHSPEKKRVLLLAGGILGENYANMLRDLFVSFDHCKNEEELKTVVMSGGYTHCVYDYSYAHSYMKPHLGHLRTSTMIAIKDMGIASNQPTDQAALVIFEPVTVIGLARMLNKVSTQTESADSNASETELGSFELREASALIVDDNMVNLIVGGEVLRQYGMEVAEVDSGANALKLCESTKYDIIFMDHMMPDMDGVETADRIRKSGGLNADTPIIVLTANAVSGMKDFFLENGMNGFMSKPIDMREMSRILLEFLSDKADFTKQDAGADAEPQESDSASSSQNERFDFLHESGVNAREAVKNLGGKVDIYWSVLNTFVNDLNPKLENLSAYTQSGNWNAFRIEVHGLKSALANIGARDLSLKARNLEIAAGEDRRGYIKGQLPDFLNGSRVLGEKLSCINLTQKRSGNSKGGYQASGKVRDILYDARNYLEELENEEAVSLLDSILLYRHDKGIDDSVSTIRSHVETFRYDEAIEMITEMIADL